MSTNNIKDGVTLKSLQTRLEKEKAEYSVLARQKNDIEEKMRGYSTNITNLLAHIKELSNKALTLTEHAKLRFLERVELIPLDQVESRVITDELIRCWKILGNGAYPIGIGEHLAVIKNGFITTIK